MQTRTRLPARCSSTSPVYLCERAPCLTHALISPPLPPFSSSLPSPLESRQLPRWGVRLCALQFGWVEQPRADRWHRRPTARFGGIGILAGLAVAVSVFTHIPQQLVGLSLLALGMFTIGLVDDVIGLRPQSKLVTQIGAGVLLYLVGFRFNASLPWAVDFFIVLVWVVAITNAMNLLDNMDGLAAGIAVIAGLFRLALYLSDGNQSGALLSAAFVGAVSGFLIFNFSPASIFMGDCGSFLIGFVLAAL